MPALRRYVGGAVHRDPANSEELKVITVFGSINLDLIGGVERLPRPGETVPGGAFATAPGGKGANQALAARRAGSAVRMVGAVGADGFAETALSLLRADGVNLGLVAKVDAPTGVALILVDRVGENVIVVIPGANGTVSATQAETLSFAADDVLLLQLEVPVAAVETVARRARAAGARVLLNFAPFRAEAIGAAAHATHLVVNETECALIAEALGLKSAPLETQARALSERWDAAVIVTIGKDGVVAVAEGRAYRAEALPVDPVDTVGAGDTFCGYLAAALAEGQTLDAALALAAAAGSLACTKAGAQPSIPSRGEVEAARR
jgi:ribokinase